VIGFLFSLSLGLWTIVGRGEEDGQPIAYNHQKHVSEAGMACLDCHANAETHERASIPNIGTCGNCHSDTTVDNLAQRQVAEYVAKGALIPWKQIHIIPDYAYFSHRRHVKLGQMDCATCHGDVGAMITPITKPFVPLKMGWCMDCHEQHVVSNDCAACHR